MTTSSELPSPSSADPSATPIATNPLAGASVPELVAIIDEIPHLIVDRGIVTAVGSSLAGETGVAADRWLGRPIDEIGEVVVGPSVDRLLEERSALDLRLTLAPDTGVVHLRSLGSIGDAVVIEVLSLTEAIADHDELTGLPHAAPSFAHLRRCLAVAEPEAETVIARISIENLAPLIDRLGDEAGEEFRLEVAKRLRSIVRSVDLVGQLDRNEFVVISPGSEGWDDADDLTKRLADALAEPVHCAGVPTAITMRIGYTRSADGDRDPDRLLEKTSLAVAEARRKASPRPERFDEALETADAERGRRSSMLAAAIDADQFVIHFQQLVGADGRRPVGVEALARWQHPEDGLLTADAFIGLAEDSGFITTLGMHLIELAVADFVSWPADTPDFLAVNMSPQQLAVTGAAHEVLAILAAAELEPERLVVEMTEGAFAKGPVVLDNLAALRGAGVRIFLDDFGTGYSSLSYLRRFPVDGIKIDRSFLHPEIDRGLVRIIVEIAATMDVLTVAEGIESQEALDEVVELGVDYVQGYLIDRPGPMLPSAAKAPADATP